MAVDICRGFDTYGTRKGRPVGLTLAHDAWWPVSQSCDRLSHSLEGLKDCHFGNSRVVGRALLLCF